MALRWMDNGTIGSIGMHKVTGRLIGSTTRFVIIDRNAKTMKVRWPDGSTQVVECRNVTDIVRE